MTQFFSNLLDRIALARALETLPNGYRTIFELHEIQGYEHREIARILHCSVGNSKSQLHKAKERMRECLSHRPQATQHLQKPCSSRLAMQGKIVLAARDHGFRLSSDPALRGVVRKSVSQETQPVLVLGSSTQCLAEMAASYRRPISIQVKSTEESSGHQVTKVYWRHGGDAAQ